jgi:hypothetical protein
MDNMLRHPQICTKALGHVRESLLAISISFWQFQVFTMLINIMWLSCHLRDRLYDPPITEERGWCARCLSALLFISQPRSYWFPYLSLPKTPRTQYTLRRDTIHISDSLCFDFPIRQHGRAYCGLQFYLYPNRSLPLRPHPNSPPFQAHETQRMPLHSMLQIRRHMGILPAPRRGHKHSGRCQYRKVHTCRRGLRWRPFIQPMRPLRMFDVLVRWRTVGRTGTSYGCQLSHATWEGYRGNRKED